MRFRIRVFEFRFAQEKIGIEMHVKTRRKLKRAFVQIEERLKAVAQRYAFG